MVLCGNRSFTACIGGTRARCITTNSRLGRRKKQRGNSSTTKETMYPWCASSSSAPMTRAPGMIVPVEVSSNGSNFSGWSARIQIFVRRLVSKLMLVVGAVYLLAASPFIFGHLRLSMHEGAYAAIFMGLNSPALMVVSKPMLWAESVLPKMSPRISELLGITSCLLFWLVLAALVGVLIDRYRTQDKARRPRRRH